MSGISRPSRVWLPSLGNAKLLFVMVSSAATKSPADWLKDVVRALVEGYGPEKIVAFGSLARGDADPYSDIDLVVIKRTEKRFVERLVEAGSCVEAPVSVDLFVYTPEEFQAMAEQGNPFIERVLKEGRVIYEKSH